MWCCQTLALFLTVGSFAQSLPPDKDLTVSRDIDYANVFDSSHRLDLYLPRNRKGLIPVVLWVHGGGWISGDKANAHMLSMVDLGYAVASINYRFSQHAIFPAQIYDCKAAVRWLRANAVRYHLNPDKVGAAGDSAGGQLVALLGTTANDSRLEGSEGNPAESSAVQAVCDFYGPTDLVSVEGQCTAEQLEIVQPLIEQLLGASPLGKPNLARLASPRFQVSEKSCPFFISQGDQDEFLPLQQSIELNDVLKKVGVDSTLNIVKGGRHGVMDPLSLEKAIQFMRHQLGN